jgi:hypothetical protein
MVVVRMPMASAVRAMRSAISLRLAMRRDEMGVTAGEAEVEPEE